MNITLFCQSLASDWNHGNAHFLRGVVGELRRRGHSVDVLEPENGWSRRNLVGDAGANALEDFQRQFPELSSRTYDPASLDLGHELREAELVLVHDWNEPELVGAIGTHRRERGDYWLLFYDAHHRAATAPEQVEAFDLTGYDAVLAFGTLIRDLYLEHGWARHAFVWHEAADTHLFRPLNGSSQAGELVWIGNWGDGERTAELEEFLLAPAKRLHLSGHVHGVRYPPQARAAVWSAGLSYQGWLPNHRVPAVFSEHRLTVHIPRRAYVRRLPGIPTIRVFEALACGIPLVCAPWEDRDRLFAPGEDYLVARDGAQMAAHLRVLLDDPDGAARLADHGLQTIRRRHTCAHRVDELFAIVEELR